MRPAGNVTRKMWSLRGDETSVTWTSGEVDLMSRRMGNDSIENEKDIRIKSPITVKEVLQKGPRDLQKVSWYMVGKFRD